MTPDVRKMTCGVCLGSGGAAPGLEPGRFWGDCCAQCGGLGKVKVLVQITLGGRTRKTRGRRAADVP